MYNQSFSATELYLCTTQAERRNSGLSKEVFINAIQGEVGQTLTDGTYQFQIKQVSDLFLNGRHKGNLGYLCQDLILRKLYKNIRRIYSIKQADRNAIVKQMISLLSENVDIWVARLDVKHFYESIDRTAIINKLIDDARLSYHSLVLLQSLFNNPAILAGQGLPRGLGISAVMAELFLKYFDLEIKRVEGVYYYARFVDDIIVFCSSEKGRDEVMKYADVNLNTLGLQLNRDKSYTWCPDQRFPELTYLGYTFQKKGKQLSVTIAKKKLNVIKTRITRSFVRYAKDHQYDMLKLRIKFLTGNFTLYQKDTLAPIKVGIFFNYKYATDLSDLDDLDRYYQKMLHCRTGKLGVRVALSKNELKSLEKYSFRFGYEHHVNHHFTIDQMTTIKNCWL